jgi:hypothetical protein
MIFDPYTKMAAHLDSHKDLQHRPEVNFRFNYPKNVLVNSVYLNTKCAFPVLFIMTIA